MSLSPLIVAATLAARRDPLGFRAFWLGAVTGVVYFCGTLYWLSQVMAIHGGLPMIVAGLLAFGLACYLSVFVGLFAWLVGASARRFGMAGVWLAPVFWVSTEWLRAWLGGAFPWVLLGSSQANALSVVQLASVTGVYGLSALVALVGTTAAAVALTPRRAPVRAIVVVGALLVGVVGWGAWRLHRAELMTAGTPVRIGLLQGNIPQEAKWNPAYRDAIMDRYIGLSRQAIGAGAQIVIWPEASTPFYFDVDAAMAEPVRRLAAQAQTPFLIGTDEFEQSRDGRPDRYFNAAVLVGADGRSQESYRKIRLVPFGEYVPFKRLLFFVGPLVEAVSDFSAGEEATVFDAQGTRFSVAICYEAVYADLAREFVAHGSELLATITNDAWFGRTSAAYQHFEQAGLRAVEQGRFLVRAANTGVSGAVDPYGRVLARTPLFETRMTTVDVRRLSGRTIYHAMGDVVAWLALAITALVAIQLRRGRATGQSSAARQE